MQICLRKLAPVLCIAAAFALNARAQTPAGSTGECKDGTYSSAASKRGACAGHGGVKDWYANGSAAAEKKEATKAATVAPPVSAGASTPTNRKAPTTSTPMPTTAAAGGGHGLVWVNASSKVYHCEGTKWYGMTKKGEYMSEADAKAKGAHADHGKACT